MRVVFIVAAGLAVGYGLFKTFDYENPIQTLDEKNSGDTLSDMLIKLARSFNFVGVSNMRNVDRSLVNNKNVRAMFKVIRSGESNLTPAAYSILCGGGQFSDFADHPRPVLPRPCTRGASGAFQITIATWDWVRGIMRLPDFTPESQELAALGLMAYRGALPAVLAGNLPLAFERLRKEWTSLPGAAENQLLSATKAAKIFADNGGITSQV